MSAGDETKLKFTQQITQMIHNNKGVMENTHKCTFMSLLVVTNMFRLKISTTAYGSYNNRQPTCKAWYTVNTFAKMFCTTAFPNLHEIYTIYLASPRD